MKDAGNISAILGTIAKSYRVEPAGSAAAEELARFFKRAYADQYIASEYRDEKSIIERWNWHNTRNPCKDALPASSWICRENASGRIAGHFGVMPVSLKYKKTYHRAVWGRDLVVLPELRKLGVGVFLIDGVLKAVRDKAAAFLIAGLNDRMFAIYKMFGFNDVGAIPLYIRINRLDLVIGGRVTNGLAARALNLVGAAALKAIDAPSAIFRHRHGARKNILIGEISRFDSSFDKLWDRAAASFGLVVKRDSARLNWRFVDQPFWKYRIFKASRRGSGDGGPAGYIVLREGAVKNMRAGVITDVFSAADDPDAAACLVNFALSYFANKDDIALVRCDMMNRAFGRALKNCGFMTIAPASRFIFSSFGPGLDGAFLANPDNWLIDYGDSDLDLSGRRSA